jgi:DNA-binding beta-propeller fold protein YncE
MSVPVDSFAINGANTTIDPRPRGIAFSPTGDTVYVAQFNASNFEVVQRFIGSPIASVTPEEGLVATGYELSQNYPNPFNPSTKITFSLKEAGSISLKVYDVLGKEVAVLAEGSQAPGVYSVSFDAKNLSSGMYFYTLRTSNGFSQTKKMMLMK